MHKEGKLIRWQYCGRCGRVVVELWYGQPDYVHAFRLSGSPLPACLLGPVIDAALGTQWREKAAGEPEVRYLRSGRVRVSIRGMKGELRLSRSLRLEEDVFLPTYALAAMVGPQGLGEVLPAHEEIEVR